jgi:creatinine amidohydrolase/Fe(II)-dependent formamide hydrolase-like protein
MPNLSLKIEAILWGTMGLVMRAVIFSTWTGTVELIVIVSGHGGNHESFADLCISL